MGINDAFDDAERLTAAIGDTIAGRRSWNQAMAAYQRARDAAVLPMYELTDAIAQLVPPPPELQQILGAIHGNQEEMDAFISVNASTLPVPEFFAAENVDRIMTKAGAGAERVSL
jgi:hypothetical protein